MPVVFYVTVHHEQTVIIQFVALNFFIAINETFSRNPLYGVACATFRFCIYNLGGY